MNQPRDPAAPEFLEPGGGGPISPEPRARRRSPLLLSGLGVLTLGVVGGAAFGAYWYLAEGAQAAEAFPADTVGYVGLTLDPSGRQKLEALETLKKLPTVTKELDLEGPVEDIDVKQSVVEALIDATACDLDYATDVEPWLGDRFGVGAVPTGEALPSMVVSLEVSDADAADAGMRDLVSCDGSDPESNAGWAVAGDWMIVGETAEIAEQVVAAAGQGSLADDADFQRWTAGAGEAGVVTLYAAPEAPKAVSEAVGGLFGAGLGGLESPYSDEPAQPAGPSELDEALEDFEGMAAVLRFADGVVEVEAAGAAGDATEALGGGAGELVAGLPDETTAVFAAGFTEGWVEGILGEDAPSVDLEALLGEAAALAIGPDLDPEALLESVFTGQVGEVPVAVVTRGELADAETALTEAGPLAVGLEARQAGDHVLVGPGGAWLDAVEAGGSLGGSDLFSSVVPDATEAVMVLFLDLDVLADVADEADPAGDLEQLRALGVSAHVDGDVARAVLRLTTD